MAIDLKQYIKLCEKLTEIDFSGRAPDVLPRFSSAVQLEKLIENGAALLPQIYRQNYAISLERELPSILIQLQGSSAAVRTAALEPFCAPVYEHAKNGAKTNVKPQLRRFLAVVSNLYRSFVDRNKRSSVNVPIVTSIPPLAFFQSDGNLGPYTITQDTMQKNLGTPIGVVSLPATYRNHPVIWASLTHEVCGHDVVHADPALVPELVSGIRSLFSKNQIPSSGPFSGGTLNALIWSYWIDEAVADVYGILNMGPTFALNLAAFFSGLGARAFMDAGRQPLPFLRMDSGPDPDNNNKMDEHPTDILRLHLAIGVIEALPNLAASDRARYIDAIKAVATKAANGGTQVRLQGLVEIDHTNWREINETIPLAAAQDGARRAGGFLATAQLAALGGHGIQDIETWDDADEAAANRVATLIAQGKSIVAAGDDAQLLAGATIALVARPDLYASAGQLLDDALDDSYQHDPIWGGIDLDRMFIPGSFSSLAKAQSQVARPKKSRVKVKP
jgi:hypothetical protein